MIEIIDVTIETFKDRMKAYNKYGKFSDRGLEALYKHLIALCHTSGDVIEFDELAIMGEFEECSVFEDGQKDNILNNYGYKCISELRANRQVIDFEGGFIVQK